MAQTSGEHRAIDLDLHSRTESDRKRQPAWYSKNLTPHAGLNTIASHENSTTNRPRTEPDNSHIKRPKSSTAPRQCQGF